MKQQIVIDFERWYNIEFENSGDSTVIQQTYMGTTNVTQGGDDAFDDDAETYLRAKRHIDTLHRAKKYEKANPTGFKKK